LRKATASNWTESLKGSRTRTDGAGLSSRCLTGSATVRQNREAESGRFAFSKKTAPAGLAPLARYGNDVVVVWGADDLATDNLLNFSTHSENTHGDGRRTPAGKSDRD
jgi:hypothetical protein